MSKIKFILRRLAHFNFKAMFQTAKKVSKITKKNSIIVLLDIIYCGLKYQAGYNDYLEFEFYLLNGKQRKTYLTAGINNQIVKKYNNRAYWHVFDDKIEFNYTFKDYVKRDWIDLRRTDLEEFNSFIKKHPIIIVKPIDDCGGKGVEKVVVENYSSAEELYNKLKKNLQLLVEEFVEQNSEMARLYPDSVNTLRMFTINNGESHYLQGILKLGNGGSVDNFSSGGMYTFVEGSGKVIAPAIDKKDNKYYEHPITNEGIVGFVVPMFEQAKEMVCKAALEVPEVGYVGWDVAITNEGPIIIEGNCYPGVFQLKPSLSTSKEGILIKYNKYINI